jgi:hypothetical protein
VLVRMDAKEIQMTLEQRAATLWPDRPAYQKAWLRMIALLGDKWLLAATKGTV